MEVFLNDTVLQREFEELQGVDRLRYTLKYQQELYKVMDNTYIQ